jgi:hypothetical protein
MIDVCVRPNDYNIMHFKSALQIYFFVVVYSFYKELKGGGGGEVGDSRA